MFYIFPNIVIIFHLCLRFSRNPLCAVQDARASDFVVAVFLADRVEGGIEFTAFLLLFGIFEEGELFEIVFGKPGHATPIRRRGSPFQDSWKSCLAQR